jgi:hypothetical protein
MQVYLLTEHYASDSEEVSAVFPSLEAAQKYIERNYPKYEQINQYNYQRRKDVSHFDYRAERLEIDIIPFIQLEEI